MNGVHDMGGLQGFGAVRPERDEPVFHAAWERRALALTLAMGATGEWNLDMARSARESLPPAQYLSSSYYQIWLAGLQRLLLQRGLVEADELATGHRLHVAKAVARVLQAADVDAALARGAPTERPPRTPARFAVGDAVRARNVHPRGHTRLPRYVRGHVGVVTRLHGMHVFADRHAEGDFEEQWLYAVEFSGAELWGEAAEPGLRVAVDAWQPYLESG